MHGLLNILLITNHRRFKIHFRALPWAEALAARGHRVDVLCHADRERWNTIYEECDGVRIVHNPDLLVGALRQGWDPVCALRRAGFLFRDNRQYDIIHCLDTRPAVVLPALTYARIKGIPIVSDWIDWWGRGGLIRERRPLWYRILFGAFETFFEEHFRNRLDGLTTISSALLERGVKLGVPRDRCIRIPGGANLSHFRDISSREEARQALNIRTGVPVVCFSGLDVLIDLSLAVDAFGLILDSLPNSVLLLVGPAASHFQKLPGSNRVASQVVCTGPVPYADLPRYLPAADVFLMPYASKVSNIGRWPNKIGDYMCVGRPTISNPVGEVKWLFEKLHIGLLADETPEGMAHAALALLNDPKRSDEMGRQAREAARDLFAWEHLVQDLERWYHQILASTAPHPLSQLHSSVQTAGSAELGAPVSGRLE